MRVGLSFLMSLTWVGGAGYSQHTAPASLSREIRAEQPLASAQPASTDSNLSSDYVIGPQDVLDIEVFNFPELTKTVRVANDGTVTVPLLRQVQASGFTTQQFRKNLETEYSRTYLRDAQVSVSVREFHARPVSVIGAVGKPGLYQLIGPRKLIEMLSLAGGPSRTAGRTVLVTRPGGFDSLSQAEAMHLVAPNQVAIDLRRLLYSEDPTLNIVIKPLDTISVTTADTVYVVGAVKKPGGFAMEDRGEVTILQALAMAGGLEGTASKGRAQIIRRHADGSKEQIPVDLGKVLKGKAPDLGMAANDILFVPSSTGRGAAKRGAEAVIGTVSGLIIYRGLP